MRAGWPALITNFNLEMGTQTKHRRRSRRLAATLVIAAGALIVAVAASAASLNGIRGADLFAMTSPVSIPVDPPLLADDSFTGCQNFLDGWVDSVGRVWTSHEGDWQCFDGEVARNQRRHSIGHVTLDIEVSDDVEITTFISRISHQKGRSGPGIALFSQGDSFLSVVYKRDQDRVVLGMTDPDGFVELHAAVAPISDYAEMTMTVRIDQPNLTVLIDGIEVMQVDLDDYPEVQSLLGNTWFGLASDNDNFSRFDTFQVVDIS